MTSKKELKVAANAALLQGAHSVPVPDGQMADFHDDLQIASISKAALLTPEGEELQHQAVDSCGDHIVAESAFDDASQPMLLAEVSTHAGNEPAGSETHAGDHADFFSADDNSHDDASHLMAEADISGGGMAALGGGLLVLGGVGAIALGGGAAFDAVRGQDPQPENVHVVVDQNGAYIDTNANGMHDKGETTAAVFSHGGNADLYADQVTIHYNDVPGGGIEKAALIPTGAPLDLTGFNADDKIEIDVAAMRHQTSLVNAQLHQAPATQASTSSAVGLHTKNHAAVFVTSESEKLMWGSHSIEHISTYGTKFPGPGFNTSKFITHGVLGVHADYVETHLNQVDFLIPSAPITT